MQRSQFGNCLQSPCTSGSLQGRGEVVRGIIPWPGRSRGGASGRALVREVGWKGSREAVRGDAGEITML